MGRLDDCYNIADLREVARKRLPKGVFQYLDLGTEDFEELLRDCDCEVENVLSDDDDSGSAEGESAAAGQLPRPPGTESAASCRQEVVTNRNKETKGPKAKSNKLYLAAVHKEEVQVAIERNYARRGLAYLSEDELNKRNLAYGPVKRDISTLL
jgi:hypothetical protein